LIWNGSNAFSFFNFPKERVSNAPKNAKSEHIAYQAYRQAEAMMEAKEEMENYGE
jgi:hypothetical protein